VTNSFKNKNVMQSMRRFNMSSREKMVTNSFKNKNVMQSRRRLNMSSRDFLFWVLGGEEWAGRKRREVWLCIYFGEWGPKGCFNWGLTNVPEKLEMSQSMWLLFPFQKNKFSLAYGCPLTIPKTISKIIMSFSNLTTFFFLNNNCFSY